jgi:hypothetical protein
MLELVNLSACKMLRAASYVSFTLAMVASAGPTSFSRDYILQVPSVYLDSTLLHAHVH